MGFNAEWSHGFWVMLCFFLSWQCNLSAAKLILHAPSGEDADLLGPICPRYVDFGIQNVSAANTTRVRIFAIGSQDMNWLCEGIANITERQKLRELYRGNILVVPRSVELTLDLTDRSSRFGYIEHICSLGAYIVITKVPRYLANARPADSFRSLGSATSTCAIFAAQQVLTAQEIRMLGRDNNFTATLVVDENDYIKFFRWIPFQIIYKGALGAAYLATGVYSLYILVLRILRNSLTLIFGVVLFANFATMIHLGVIQCMGAHFTDNKLPENVVSFTLSIYFGTSVGTGILIVILYDELINNMFSSKRSLFRKNRSGLLWTSGMTMIVLDVAVGYLTGFGRVRQLGDFLRITVSVGFLIAQLAVIYAIYVKARAVMNMLKRLTGFRSKLERHFRFWLKAMVLSAFITLCGIYVVASSGQVSPALYADFSIALTLGKIMYVFSQSKLCAPVKESAMKKVATAAVSSVGYETFTAPKKEITTERD